MKIRGVGAELFHAEGRKEGRTYMTKLIVAFRNFANMPTTVTVYSPQDLKATLKHPITAAFKVDIRSASSLMAPT